MKFLSLFVFGLFSIQSFATEAVREAKEWRVYEQIKFKAEQKVYESDLNLMEDGLDIPEGYTYIGYGLKFSVGKNEDYAIFAKFESDDQNAKGKCEYSKSEKALKKGRTLITVDLLGDPDVDSGDKCVYTIDFADGRQAKITLYSEGT